MLLTTQRLTRGEEKPTLTFVGQVIINASQRSEVSPFIYCVSNLPKPSVSYIRARPLPSSSKVCHPPSHLVDRFGVSCFQCGRAGHWHANCPHTTGVANPNPHPVSPTPFRQMRPPTPDQCTQQPLGAHYHQERVSQVHFVEQDTSKKVLIDTGVSIHLSGAMCFATCMRSVSPLRIFFSDSNSSILISQMMTLKLPVNGGSVLVHDVAYSNRILGTILSVGHLRTAGVVPCFDDLDLSLLVTTTFKNNCWWMDVLTT
ncbi:hypothetical protein O181_007375 [Austropuccinia psidii MF-1]|uniref:CCHC-type domain-containing protein n=1 Tax=Austropuccinia psidii MF-1 TaxID=1389203 RepID=A0A9Q3BM97_9BASI|nr:hypothetical protein [Austropuccinia psidii MF-1]